MTVDGAIGVSGVRRIPVVTSLARTLSGERGVIVLLDMSLETVPYVGLGRGVTCVRNSFLCSSVGTHYWVRLSCHQQRRLPVAFEHWEIVGKHLTSRDDRRCLKGGGSFVGRLLGLTRGCCCPAD